MNKSEFISAIGNRTLKKDAEVKPIIDTAITILTETLASPASAPLKCGREPLPRPEILVQVRLWR